MRRSGAPSMVVRSQALIGLRPGPTADSPNALALGAAFDCRTERIADMATGQTRHDGVDVAMAHLVRLVVDEAWTAQDAAARLLGRVRQRAALRRLRTKVVLAQIERPGRFGERAIATLDAALALGQHRSVSP